MPSPHLGWRSRGYLPHCDSPGLHQHIVFCLKDAAPKRAHGLSLEALDLQLDAASEGLLLQASNAAIIEDCLLFGDSIRYRLIAWCVMPNHVHVLIEQAEGWPLHKVVHGWKSVSANRVNVDAGRTGAVWQREYFDRFMRDDAQLSATIDYVERNPVAAGLASAAEEWPWSSARRR
ncbi:MAG: transposase [Alphaproteobacteria bacterium]|nr:transposase [Alphaproteobacteria bacterium]